MMKNSSSPKCETCAYFSEAKLDGELVEATCRRYPPVPIFGGRSSAFPVVLEDDSCGEHQNSSRNGSQRTNRDV